jgi:bla regulator protein blaR1
MKILLDSFSSVAISAFGWTLVHSLWQGTLLAALAGLLFQVFRRKSAQLRYNVGILLLTTQALASLATFVWYRWIASTRIAYLDSESNLQTIADNISPQRIEYQLSFSSKIQLWFYVHLNELIICWLIGAGFLILRFLGGWIYTEVLRSESRAVPNNEWRTRFGLLAAQLNISTNIELRETTRILTPMVIGIVRPVVLIPMGLLTGFSTSQVEAILAHELAHVRRSDFLVNMLQSLVEVVYFFHPGLWWLSEKIRNERENCCDDIAVGICGDRISLANALVKVAEWQSAPTLAMAFASKKPMLLHRVRRLLGLTPKPAKTFASLPFLLITLSLLIGASMYATGQQEQKITTARAAKKITSKKMEVNADTNIIQPIEEIREINAPQEAVTVRVPLEITADTLKSNAITVTGTTLTFSSVPDGNPAIISPARALTEDETDKIGLRIEELRLEHEKLSFDAERARRQTEKLEWKKQAATEARYRLMEKRSAILNPSKSGTSPSENVEKQLVDFEEQIKTQEDAITKLNAELIESRREVYNAEEPLRNIERNIEELSRKIDHSFEAVAMVPGMPVKPLKLHKVPKPAMPSNPAAVPKPGKLAKIAHRSQQELKELKIAPPPPPVEAIKIAPSSIEAITAPAKK